MGVKSASETIKQLVQQEQTELERLRLMNQVEPEVPTEELLIPVLESYTKLLTGFLGPAAEIVVEEAVDTWKKTYVQRAENLPYLLALLEAELDSPQEREAFATKAAGVVLSAV